MNPIIEKTKESDSSENEEIIDNRDDRKQEKTQFDDELFVKILEQKFDSSE